MYNLLIADDEREIRQALGNYIPWNDMGFRVVGLTDNGKKALGLIQKKDVDVVLCDIRMPKMNGIELAEIIHRQQIRTRIVFLSAYEDFNYAKKAIAYGVEDYIVKPTKYQEIMEVFTELKKRIDSDRENSSLKNKINNQNFEKMKNTSSNTFNEKIILTVKSLVKENFQTATLENIAKKVHMSPSYLSEFFKKITGENFSNYVFKIKMEAAKELLLNIDYKIYEVSNIIGYSSPKNFTRAFKKYTGQTPSQYRKGEPV